MLVMLGRTVGQHKTGQTLSASLSQRKACCSSSIQCNTRRDTGAASVATCIKSTLWFMDHQVVSKSINQPINTFNVLGGIWDQQTTTLLCFLQSLILTLLLKYAKHSLRKPSHAFGSHKDTKSAIVEQGCRRSQRCDLIWLYAGQ